MKCHICNNPISGNYYIDSWDHKVCATHIDSGEVAACSSCTGFTDKTNSLPDGRVLCQVCMNNAITKSDNITPLFEFTIKNLRRVGFDDLNVEDVSVEVVTAEFMANLRGGVVNTRNKGLAQSRVSNSFGLFGSSRKMQHTIYMLSHQPKAEFVGTLAHELLHAWQVQNEIAPPPPLCEGLCNLASYHVLSVMPSSLSKVLINNMKISPDPIYGDGFRTVLEMYEDVEWSGVIDFYRQKTF
ncbi:MAG: hypothetical protein SNJ29_09110 [Rikenellaceae bacterium]